MSQTDHVRIDFTSDVPDFSRKYIIEDIQDFVATSDQYGAKLWIYQHIDRNTGQLVIEITAHDRETFDLTDGQVVERLRVTAKQQGISVKELLRRLATE